MKKAPQTVEAVQCRLCSKLRKPEDCILVYGNITTGSNIPLLILNLEFPSVFCNHGCLRDYLINEGAR